MLVVIIIIAIVSTIGTNTYKNQRSQVRYNDSIIKVLSLVKMAKNYSISSRPVFDESKPAGEENYIPKEGYGVYFERSEIPGKSRIILFANTQANEDEAEKNQYDEGKDVIEEEYILDDATQFFGLWSDIKDPPATIGGADENKAVVIFRPPLAEGFIAANDNPQLDSLTVLQDLYLEFKRNEADAKIPSQFIHINKISGVAEVIKK